MDCSHLKEDVLTILADNSPVLVPLQKMREELWKQHENLICAVYKPMMEFSKLTELDFPTAMCLV